MSHSAKSCFTTCETGLLFDITLSYVLAPGVLHLLGFGIGEKGFLQERRCNTVTSLCSDHVWYDKFA